MARTSLVINTVFSLEYLQTFSKILIMPAAVPPNIAILLVVYFCHIALEAQRLQFDDWICASDDNMRVFDAYLDASLAAKVYDPDRHDEPDLGIVIVLN